MGFLAAELIASCHAVPSLSDRVKAADFDGPHKMNKRPSNHERLSPRRRRQNEKNEWGRRKGRYVGGVCDYVFLCMCVCAGGSKRMIETSNQSCCRVERPSRRLLPVVTLLSVQSSLFFYSFPSVWSIWVECVLEDLLHTPTLLLNPLCDNLCHVNVHCMERRENTKSTLLQGGMRVVYFH